MLEVNQEELVALESRYSFAFFMDKYSFFFIPGRCENISNN